MAPHVLGHLPQDLLPQESPAAGATFVLFDPH
jgi:hypothetical protein